MGGRGRLHGAVWGDIHTLGPLANSTLCLSLFHPFYHLNLTHTLSYVIAPRRLGICFFFFFFFFLFDSGLPFYEADLILEIPLKPPKIAFLSIFPMLLSTHSIGFLGYRGLGGNDAYDKPVCQSGYTHD